MARREQQGLKLFALVLLFFSVQEHCQHDEEGQRKKGEEETYSMLFFLLFIRRATISELTSWPWPLFESIQLPPEKVTAAIVRTARSV